MHLNTKFSAHLMLRGGPRGSMQQCPPKPVLPSRSRSRQRRGGRAWRGRGSGEARCPPGRLPQDEHGHRIVSAGARAVRDQAQAVGSIPPAPNPPPATFAGHRGERRTTVSPMTQWQEENRPPTQQEAQAYLDSHEESDDPEAWGLSDQVVTQDEHQPSHGYIQPSPYASHEDLTEEAGAD